MRNFDLSDVFYYAADDAKYTAKIWRCYKPWCSTLRRVLGALTGIDIGEFRTELVNPKHAMTWGSSPA